MDPKCKQIYYENNLFLLFDLLFHEIFSGGKGSPAPSDHGSGATEDPVWTLSAFVVTYSTAKVAKARKYEPFGWQKEDFKNRLRKQTSSVHGMTARKTNFQVYENLSKTSGGCQCGPLGGQCSSPCLLVEGLVFILERNSGKGVFAIRSPYALYF